jgi:hypothetical protein
MKFQIEGTYTHESNARLFDSKNINWNHDKDLNEYFLSVIHQWCLDKVARKGWLTLNEVYVCLGFHPTPEGAVIGWKTPPKHLELYRIFQFTAGSGDSLVIEFFVDGVIYCNIGVKEVENNSGTQTEC